MGTTECIHCGGQIADIYGVVCPHCGAQGHEGKIASGDIWISIIIFILVIFALLIYG